MPAARAALSSLFSRSRLSIEWIQANEAAALLAFALSIDDYVITLFSAGHTVTFPLWVYGASRIGIPPEVNALGTVFFLIAFLFIAVQIWAQRRGGRDTESGGPVATVASR